MNRWMSLVLASAMLTGCGSLPTLSTGMSGVATSSAADAASYGGLSASQAVHVSVQLGQPAAYALSPQAGPFLDALASTVAPMRRSLANRLKADTTVSAGLAAWDRATAAQQLATLKRVAAIQAEVMGCEAPSITMTASQAAEATMMAYYQPGSGAGEVVLYQSAIARAGKYKAIATIVHEVRHAAQYQLVQGAVPADSDERTLRTAYAASWQALDALGGEGTLAYGDYAHLNVEFDAFQTGNEVASRLSNGSYDALGFGFVDTHYAADGTVKLDLVSLASTLVGAGLVAAVNQAEYQAEKGRSVPMSPVRPQRGGFTRGGMR
jgi:hypothetical protein